jgi:dTDP-glucose 4,6-dehydratase
MKLLITDGVGFIRSALVLHIINASNEHVINTDKLTYAGNLESLICVETNECYSHKN